MTELIKAKEINPAELFAKDKAVDSILSEITQKAHEVVALPSTATGRKTLASVAHRVARSKTLLDNMGKALVAGIKKEAGEIDARRRKIRETLDELKAEVRLPLTKWEEREKARVDAIEVKLTEMRELFYHPINDSDADATALAARKATLSSYEIDDSFAEFAQDAEITRKEQIQILEEVEAKLLVAAEAKRKYEEAAAAEAKRIASARAELKAAAKAKCMAAADAKRMAAAAEAKLRESIARAQRNQNKPNERKSEDGSNKVHIPNHKAQGQETRDVPGSETESQSEDITPAQKTQAVDEMENRGGAQTVNALPESEGISPAELAALDMCRFGVTPQVAKMLVVAIQVGEINHVHFVEGI